MFNICGFVNKKKCITIKNNSVNKKTVVLNYQCTIIEPNFCNIRADNREKSILK